MARPPESSLDDVYRAIQITDFSGGLVTVSSPLSLAANQSPSMLNVLHLPGRLIFRGGYGDLSDIPAAADAAWSFYDTNGTKHYCVWAGGTLYDCATGVSVAVDAASYTAGSRVGTVDLNGVLYWSCGYPNPVKLRFWDPAAGTFGAVVSTGVPGAVDPPASGFLFLYTNSIVALAPYWGMPAVPDVYQQNVFAWCDTNLPTQWLAASAQTAGPKNNGRLEYGRPFGIAEIGVDPQRTIMIMRNDFGIFAYTGALGSLQEKLLNCPVGIRDAQTAQYLPTAGQFGEVTWLGNDGQIWSTNGISCSVISTPILPTLSSAYNTALGTSANSRFYSGYNTQWQYYWCDVGGTQFVYRWPTQSWTMFSGWPSGPSFASFDGSGVPALYVASASSSAPKLSQIALIGSTDNGTMPTCYWTSPVLHGGNFNIFKDYHWCAIATFDTGVRYNMSGSSIKRGDGSYMTASTVPLIAPSNISVGSSPFVIGSSLLGGTDVLSATSPIQNLAGGTPVVMQGRFSVPIVNEWYPENSVETLKGNGAQITITHGGGPAAFDLLGVEVLYVPKGYRRGSGGLYNPEDITTNPFDPFAAPSVNAQQS